MSIRLFIILILLSFTKPMLAQQSGCFGRLCVYYPKNASASELVEYVKKAITGSELFHIKEQSGFLVANETKQEVSYYFPENNEYEITNADVAEMLEHFDKLTAFHLKKRIKFDLMIYKVKESKLKEIGLNAYGEGRSFTPSTSPSEIPSQEPGVIGGIVGFGNLTTSLLRIKLDLAKSSSEAIEVFSLPFEQENHSSISISKSEKLYRNSGSSYEEKTEDSGLSINGSVELINDNGVTKVRVNSFSFGYSVPSERADSLIESLMVYNDYTLTPGVPIVIFEENIKESFDGDKRIPGLNWLIGSSDKVYNSKLIVVLSAEILGESRTENNTIIPYVDKVEDVFNNLSANIISDYKYSFWQKIHLQFPKLKNQKAYKDVVIKVEMDGDGLSGVSAYHVTLSDLLNNGLNLPSFKLENQYLNSKLFFRLKFSVDKDFSNREINFESKIINFYYLPENRYIKLEPH